MIVFLRDAGRWCAVATSDRAAVAAASACLAEGTVRTARVEAASIAFDRRLQPAYARLGTGFASMCLSQGISVRAVAEAMGDTEATVQATYSHLMPDTDRMRRATGRFFTRPADGDEKASGGHDVP